jgi:hypothetical protein
MHEPQIDLVETKSLTINLPFVGAPMAVRTESDEVVILVRLTLCPWDNVVNIDLNVSTSGDRAPMPRLDEDAAAEVGRYWRTAFHGENSSTMSACNYYQRRHTSMTGLLL